MKTLKPSTSEYLLSAGIETLHQQTMEWLEDVAFWRDEAAFLYSLEISKTMKEIPVKAKDKLDKLNNELIQIASDDIDNLYNKIEAHEAYLDQLITSKREDEETYREKHEELASEVIKLGARLRALKKDIFDIVKLTKHDLVVDIPAKTR